MKAALVVGHAEDHSCAVHIVFGHLFEGVPGHRTNRTLRAGKQHRCQERDKKTERQTAGNHLAPLFRGPRIMQGIIRGA